MRTAEFYQGDDSLPDDFAARLDAIAKTFPASGDRLTEATRYVEDNIRYVGEEMNEGSYVPRRPRTVLARAYGDCKDKSLLLAVALRRLGIDAVPALVATEAGERLPERLPSPLLFDHVIVRAVLDGKVIWIDPTGSYRGGRGAAIVPPDLGYALPIRAGQTVLEHVDGFGERAGRVNVLEQFTVDEAASVPLTLHVETRYSDARADNMRAHVASSSAQAVSDDNLQFYRDRFPGIVESKPLELRDERDANTLTMLENYTMSREAFKKANISAKLITRAYLVQGVLPNRQADPRVQPLELPNYHVNEQTVELHVKDRILGGLPDIEVKAGPVTFFRKTSKLSDGLAMTYRLDTGTREVAAASEAGAIYAVSDTIKDEAGIEFYLDKSARAAPGPAGIDAATLLLIKPDLDKVNALLRENDEQARLEALTLLVAMAAKVAHPSPAAGLIDGLKGAVLADLKRPQAALAALQSATAQFEGNPEVFRFWIAYEIDLGTAESVAKALQRTGKVHPEIVAKLDERWVQAAMQKTRALASDRRETSRQDICIALANSGWKLSPRTVLGDIMLGCAIAAQSLRGQLVEARAGLAKDPGAGTLATMAIDRRHQALWPDVDRLGTDRFRKSLEHTAGVATVAAKAAPKDFAAVMYQMRALRALGRFEDALTAGKELASDKARFEIAGDDAFWLVNEYAATLRALGRVDEAIAALDGVLGLGVDRYPVLGSMAINRAEMILISGRYQAALDSLSNIETKNSTLSAYGKMWVWANQVCALHGLRRDDEAKALLTKLARPSDNWSAATVAAACLNDEKGIADLLIRRLGDTDDRAAVLGLFITFERPEARTPFEKEMRHALAKALAMPEVQAAFAKVGRAVRYDGTTQGWSEF